MMPPRTRCCGLLALFRRHSRRNDARSSQSILGGKPMCLIYTRNVRCVGERPHFALIRIFKSICRKLVLEQPKMKRQCAPILSGSRKANRWDGHSTTGCKRSSSLQHLSGMSPSAPGRANNQPLRAEHAPAACRAKLRRAKRTVRHR